MILFDRDTLATHCLQSRKSSLIGEDNHKPALPPEILKGFMGKLEDTNPCWVSVNLTVKARLCFVFFPPLRTRCREVWRRQQPNKNRNPHKVEQRGQADEEEAGLEQSCRRQNHRPRRFASAENRTHDKWLRLLAGPLLLTRFSFLIALRKEISVELAIFQHFVDFIVF